MKPQPEIFQVAMERAGCRPEECFYTDDIAAYVTAARALGIDAVRFVGPRSNLERELDGARHSLGLSKKNRASRRRPVEEHPESARRLRTARAEELVTPAGRRGPGRRLPSPSHDSAPAAAAAPDPRHSVWPNGSSPERK